MSSSGIKNYSYGQPDLTIDLMTNSEILSKFIKKKGLKKFAENFKNKLADFEMFFRAPQALDLSRIHKLMLKFIVLTTILLDWVDEREPVPELLRDSARSLPLEPLGPVPGAPVPDDAVLLFLLLVQQLPALLRSRP